MVSDEFMRIGKGGKPVHIQASYNPIFDMNGKVFKVVKFATDVSQRVSNVEQLALALQAMAAGDLTGSCLYRLCLRWNGCAWTITRSPQSFARRCRPFPRMPEPLPPHLKKSSQHPTIYQSDRTAGCIRRRNGRSP